jgi:membrane associated rhomboid family serine protease
MSSIQKDISFFWQKNTLNKIISICVIVHLVFSLFGLFYLFGAEINPLQTFRNNYLSVPAFWKSYFLVPWTALTAIFLHGSIFHLLMNMVVLYWAGNLFQEYLGEKRALSCFFLGAINGWLWFMLSYNLLPAYHDSLMLSRALGASGGVMALFIGIATLLPNYTIVFAIFGPVKLKWLALIYVVVDLISLPGTNSGGHWSHLGGAFFGFVFIKLLQNGRDLSIDLSKIFKPKKKKTKLKIIKNDIAHTQVEIDRILDKISASGYENLSQADREILFKASKNHEEK